MYLDSEHLGQQANDCLSHLPNPDFEERKPMNAPLWWELIGELCEVFGWFAGDDLKTEDFAQCVVAFESEKVGRFGFALSAEAVSSSKVVFTLSHTRSGQVWTKVDVDPYTGKFAISQG